jgi:hypothetical protein
MIRVAGLLATVALVAGCGQGASPVSSARAGPAAQLSPSEASPSPAATPTPKGGGSAGGGTTRTPTPPGRPTPSPSPAGLPEILSFSGSANCTTRSGRASVKLTWTSRNATEAWISNPIIASAAGDPKTTQGASGPLAPNGSLTLPFDCANQYNYYALGVYAGGRSGGEVLQVERNV